MAVMPHFAEEIAHDLHLDHLFGHEHHDAPQPAAATPEPASHTASLESHPQGGSVSLATIDADLRNDLGDGIAYAADLLARVKDKLPGIVSTVDTVSNSTVGKLAETIGESVIPPEVEPVLVGLVEDFVKRYGQAAPASIASDATPAAAPAPAA